MHISEIRTVKKSYTFDYPGQVDCADIEVDGISLRELLESLGFDLISCLGWGAEDYQKDAISRLMLKNSGDLKGNRHSLYVCPACGDMGCGGVSLEVVCTDDIVIWRDFGFEYNYGDQGISREKLNNVGPYYFNWNNYSQEIEKTYGLGNLLPSLDISDEEIKAKFETLYNDFIKDNS